MWLPKVLSSHAWVAEVTTEAVIIQSLSAHPYTFYFTYFLQSLGLNKTWKEMSYLMPFPKLHYNNIHWRKQFAYQAMKTASQLEIQMFSLIEF